MVSPTGFTLIEPFFDCFKIRLSNLMLCPTFKIDLSSKIFFIFDIAVLKSIC